jgi:hypothetical protein
LVNSVVVGIDICMSIIGASIGVKPYCPSGCGCSAGCPDLFGCPPDMCPDFTIKRHNTQPAFRVAVQDCDGALDLSDPNLVLEVNMWANAKLKRAILTTDTLLTFADNIGFQQCMVGDIIVAKRVRGPEFMLVTGFDEVNYTVSVTRGHNGTTPTAWPKGTELKIFRVISSPAMIALSYGNVTEEDGSVSSNQLLASYLQYNWQPNDTCLPGCYWLEFKLLSMSPPGGSGGLPTPPPEFYDPAAPCNMGDGVVWVRRFPETSDGFLISIPDSLTAEMF